ncbi:MAG: hypothetical protein AAFX81_06920 [Pseudomonadota bacterium]
MVHRTMLLLLSGGALAACAGSADRQVPAGARTFTSAPVTGAAATTPAARGCLDAVARELGVPVGDLTIVGSDESGIGMRIMVAAPPARAPWACIASDAGIVQEVVDTAEG